MKRSESNRSKQLRHGSQEMINMKQNIPDADIQEGKVYLFSDGEAYTAETNDSVFSGNLYKYAVVHIDKQLTKLVYDESKEVKFSDNHNAMEFSGAGHFNKFLQQEGYQAVKRLAEMVGITKKGE